MTDGSSARSGHRASISAFGFLIVGLAIAAETCFWAAAGFGMQSPYSREVIGRAWWLLRDVGAGLGPSTDVLVPLVTTVILGFYLAVIGGQIRPSSAKTINIVALQQRLTMAAMSSAAFLVIVAVLRILALIGDPHWGGRSIGLVAEVAIIALLAIELGSQLILNDELRIEAANRRLRDLRRWLKSVESALPDSAAALPSVLLMIGPLVLPALGPAVLAFSTTRQDTSSTALLITWMGMVAQALFALGHAVASWSVSRVWKMVAFSYPAVGVFALLMIAMVLVEFGDIGASLAASGFAASLLIVNVRWVSDRWPVLSTRAIVNRWAVCRARKAIPRVESSTVSADPDQLLLAALERGLSRRTD